MLLQDDRYQGKCILLKEEEEEENNSKDFSKTILPPPPVIDYFKDYSDISTPPLMPLLNKEEENSYALRPSLKRHRRRDERMVPHHTNNDREKNFIYIDYEEKHDTFDTENMVEYLSNDSKPSMPLIPLLTDDPLNDDDAKCESSLSFPSFLLPRRRKKVDQDSTTQNRSHNNDEEERCHCYHF